MKTILLTLALTALTFTSTAAEPVVVVVSATVVTVDGVSQGKPIDTMRNHPHLTSAIQRALEARESAQASALADVKAKLDAALAAHATLVGKLHAAGDNPAALVAVRAEAIAPERDKKRAALAAELAAKQKELDGLK